MDLFRREAKLIEYAIFRTGSGESYIKAKHDDVSAILEHMAEKNVPRAKLFVERLGFYSTITCI